MSNDFSGLWAYTWILEKSEIDKINSGQVVSSDIYFNNYFLAFDILVIFTKVYAFTLNHSLMQALFDLLQQKLG